MSCEKCDKEPILRAFYRWKTANVEIVACKEHWLEIREALNEAQEPNPDVSSEFPAEIKHIGIDLVDEFFPKGVCKERGQAIVLYAQLIIRFQKLMAERNKSVEQMTNHYYETSEEYKAEIARLNKALSDIATGKHPQKRCMEIAERSLEGK